MTILNNPMQTTVKINTPKEATVHFMPYMDRKTQKAIRKVVASFPNVNLTEAQSRFAEIGKIKDQKEQFKALQAISVDDQDAVFELQEVMVLSMTDKIVLEGRELDPDDFENFYNRMKNDDFVKISLCVSKIVGGTGEESEKKTEKS